MTYASGSLEASPRVFSRRGRFLANQTFHYETLRNAGYILSQCADLGEMLETTKEITEGDLQSWYGAWAATADRVAAWASRTQDPLGKDGAYTRASTYQRTDEFLLPPDDPKRPGSFGRTVRFFFQGLDPIGVRYEYLSAAYEDGWLRALYLPGSAGSEKKPLIVGVGGYDSIVEADMAAEPMPPGTMVMDIMVTEAIGAQIRPAPLPEPR